MPHAHVGPSLAQHHDELHWYKPWLLAVSPAACRVESQNAVWSLAAAVGANAKQRQHPGDRSDPKP